MAVSRPLGHSPVILAIFGTARIDHLQENLLAERLDMTPVRRDHLDMSRIEP
ncbi:MAG TPA: hypothetical protein VLG91_09550 [Streptomyces sp.]|nr:hypothetical protein [Streptomyces sp.]